MSSIPPQNQQDQVNASGPTRQLISRLSKDQLQILLFIAQAARQQRAVRIRYRDKITTGKPVYRTVHPYSLRIRDVHDHGYGKPKVPTIMFFGFDEYDRKEGPTIKNFVLDRIRSVEWSPRKFVPKWKLELLEWKYNIRKVLKEILHEGEKNGTTKEKETGRSIR